MRLALHQTGGAAGDVPATLSALDAAAATAAADGVDLLVGAEMSVTGYNIGARVAALAEPAAGPLADAVGAIAARHGLAIAYGYPERHGDRVFDAVQVVSREGQRLANYRKTHLFGTLDTSLFVAGDEPVVQFELDGARVGILVCFDVEFPEAVRLQALAGADLVIVPTGLMTPYERIATHMVPVRALESQVFLAYANRVGTEGDLTYCGLSTVVDPWGRELARGGDRDELVAVDLDLTAVAAAREETPYLTDRRPELYAALTLDRTAGTTPGDETP